MKITITQLAQVISGRLSGQVPQDAVCQAISVDSRSLRAGDVFWAIKGGSHDGHDFLSQAAAAGAVAAVVDRSMTANAGLATIQVSDTLLALQNFAQWNRQQHDAVVIGVTGSYGKTTTRSMIHAALSGEYHGLQSPRNYNNQFGVPLSLALIVAEHDFAVLELGASAIGEIRQLAAIAEPEIGVITGIGPAHLEGFGSLEGVFQGKGELFDALPREGFAVLPAEIAFGDQLVRRARCRVIRTGLSRAADIQACDVTLQPERLGFRVDGEHFEIKGTGRHLVDAALMAIAIGLEFGISPSHLRQGLAEFRPVAGRCQVVHAGHGIVIDDTYNANPCSMAAACEALQLWSGLRERVLVIGDMLELGPQAAEYHRELGRMSVQAGVDRLIVVGQFRSDVVQGAVAAGFAPHRIAECADVHTLELVLSCWVGPASAVLVKASRSLRLEHVVRWLTDWMVQLESLSGREPQEVSKICA